MSLFRELKRRNVFRVGAAYAVVAWLLIEVSDTVFPRLQLPEWSVTLVIAFLLLGFPLALFFAWAYELTPEGLKKEKDVDRSESITQLTGRKLDFVIIGLLLVAVVYFSIDKFVFEPARQAAQEGETSARLAAAVEEARQAAASAQVAAGRDDKSIAVLPFVNMSDDAGNEYFSDGISEELLNLLAKIPELRVISRSSAFTYKGTNLKLAQVAEELNVAHILEGSVRRTGNRVRITAQLIDARSDTHLWSETFDRTLEDIFAIQDEIAATVVAQLRVALLGAVPQLRETDPAAYALYLQARHLGLRGTAEGYQQAIDLLEQVLAIDPEYADAWSALAVNYINQAGSGLRQAAEGYALARSALERALAIDPDHALSYGRLGWIVMHHDRDLAQSARHFERALALEPANHAVLSNTTSLLLSLGRIDEAIMVGEYVLSRDPVDPVGHNNLAASLLSASRWDEAIAAWQTCLRLSPGYAWAHFGIGTALLMKGEAEAALGAFEQQPLQHVRAAGMAMALHALGRQPEHEARLLEAIELLGSEWPSVVAEIYAWIGEADEAFRWLGQAVEIRQTGLSDIVLSPLFTGLHNDSRWLPFLESIGQSPAQLDAIAFKVTLPDR